MSKDATPTAPEAATGAAAQAVVAFVADNYDVSGNLVGRQSASQGFLRAYLRHGGADSYVGYSNSSAETDKFREFVARHGRPGTRALGLLPTGFDRIATIGTLYRPGPDLGYYAWLRRSFDQRGFSLVGVNHTLSGADAAAAIGGLLTAPVQPWDALVCTSAASRAVIERMLAEYSAYFASLTGTELRPRLRLPLIPLGVDCDAFAPPEGDAAARAPERARLGIADDEIVLLYLGRLNHVEKANPLPMYLAAEQAAAGRKLRLIEAGWFRSPDYEQIFAQAAAMLAPSVTRTVLDGTSAENRKVWFAADIFISLADNIQESFGLTPIEAMAAGLPMVVSDWDGYRDTVRDGVDGFRIPLYPAPPAGTGEALAFLFASDFGGEEIFCGGAAQGTAVDPGAAAVALDRLIGDAELRRRMGDAARARARACYDWPVVIAAYQALWGELAELRRDAPLAAPVTPGRAARPLAMDPFALFGAFAAHTMTAETLFHLAPGIDWATVRGMARLPLATPLRSLLLPDELLDVMVTRLRQGPANAAELLRLMPAGQASPAWLTLGWLAKTGLVGWR